MMQTSRPILYSFRRCPYAMRARMAILASGQVVDLREIVLRDKPAEMLAASPKGTVPVLVLSDGSVIEESLEIMLWALGRNDPEGWLAGPVDRSQMLDLISACEADFKPNLDAYKYGAKGDDAQRLLARKRACVFLAALEERLSRHDFLFDGSARLGDIAIFPFVRQFAFVDKAWFDAAGFPRVSAWLEGFLAAPVFLDVMDKVARWAPGQAPIVFGGRGPDGERA